MVKNKNISSIKRILHGHLPVLKERYNVESIGIFGSYLHQQQTENSDLDLLVTFYKSPSLLKFVELENYLSDLLEVKVDLVMKDTLKPRIGRRILSEVMQI